jgi:hypothetical protein
MISWWPGQFVDMKWKTSPFASIMSRPLVDNGRVKAARFNADDGAAAVRDTSKSPAVASTNRMLKVCRVKYSRICFVLWMPVSLCRLILN